VNAAQLLPALRDLYSRLPEMYFRQPWELQHVLFRLGYTADLADEAEIAAVRHAGELSETELMQTVAEHREEWDVEVQAKAEKILSEAQEIADALSRKLSETEGLVGVHSWLRSSGQSYTPSSPASVSIEHLSTRGAGS
jgi:hypothetical protein